MSVFYGGLRILNMRWQSATALEVRFASGHTDAYHQLYVGDRLLTETQHPNQRQLVAYYPFHRWQEHWRVVAVTGADVGVDHSAKLPPRPKSTARVAWSTAGWTSDSDLIDIYQATSPGGAVDTNNRAARILYAGAKSYRWDSDPLGPSGNWAFRVQGRDNRPSNGNAGTAADATVDVVSIPPDFDTPFSVAVATGTATFTVTIPTD